MSERVVVVGAGHAAGQVATSLRQKGFTGSITLVGEEPWIPYQRPPLSKAFLAGELDARRLFFKPEKFYPEHDVDLVLSTCVESIDRENCSVSLSNGDSLGYDWLVLTTGSRVRKAPIPGADLENIHYLRNIADVEAIQSGFKPGANLVIIGAGYIGLEVAAVATKYKLNVTVLEMSDRPMQRVVAPEVSDFYSKLHRDAGVDLRCNTFVESFTGDGKVQSVKLKEQEPLPADMVVIGIGCTANIKLAEMAGLDLGPTKGIAVNRYMQTSNPDIFSCGDCAEKVSFFDGKPSKMKLASIATTEARIAGSNLFKARRMNSGVIGVYSTMLNDHAFSGAGLTEYQAKTHGYSVLVGEAKSHLAIP